MLHVVTVHFASPRWIEIQASHLREHLSVPYTTWTSLERIDPSYGKHFDHVIEQRGRHPGKLNHLAMEIADVSPDEDLLMFLDGDAFPIADPMPLITDSLAKAPLVAVRRAENVNDQQPHPCFCVTSVGTWKQIRGDWSGGYTWPGHRGKLVTDVGGNLLRALELSDTKWVQVLRSNGVELDPLFFGVYGDVVYHHGAGFRPGELSRAYLDQAPSPIRAGGLLRPLTRRVNKLRRGAWERRTQRRYLARSEEIYTAISRGGAGWLEAVR
jgi:hypothetical protein